jgi:hypothetical protein
MEITQPGSEPAPNHILRDGVTALGNTDGDAGYGCFRVWQGEKQQVNGVAPRGFAHGPGYPLIQTEAVRGGGDAGITAGFRIEPQSELPLRFSGRNAVLPAHAQKHVQGNPSFPFQPFRVLPVAEIVYEKPEPESGKNVFYRFAFI